MSIKTIIGPSPWQLLRDYLQMLLGTAIYTLGYTTFLLPYKIVSGGVSGIDDIRALDAAGIPAVVFGKAIYEGRINLSELARHLTPTT